LLEAFKFIFTFLLITVAFLIPELVVENALVRMGYVRDYKLVIIIGTLCLVLIKSLWLKDLSWWIWGPLIILSTVLGTNRGELGASIKHGAWWWKKTERKGKRK
jgi:hypothetical protein